MLGTWQGWWSQDRGWADAAEGAGGSGFLDIFVTMATFRVVSDEYVHRDLTMLPAFCVIQKSPLSVDVKRGRGGHGNQGGQEFPFPTSCSSHTQTHAHILHTHNAHMWTRAHTIHHHTHNSQNTPSHTSVTLPHTTHIHTNTAHSTHTRPIRSTLSHSHTHTHLHTDIMHTEHILSHSHT